MFIHYPRIMGRILYFILFCENSNSQQSQKIKQVCSGKRWTQWQNILFSFMVLLNIVRVSFTASPKWKLIEFQSHKMSKPPHLLGFHELNSECGIYIYIVIIPKFIFSSDTVSFSWKFHFRCLSMLLQYKLSIVCFSK